MLLLFAAFLLCMYLLARMLYTKWLALVTLAVLALGGRDVLRPEVLAVGGVAETLVCGSAMFLLASWLVISPHPTQRSQQWRRALAYLGWGLAAGVGMWSHLLVVPLVCASGALIAYWCWRELRSYIALVLAGGLGLGGLPLIVYNLTTPFSRNSLAVLWRIHQSRFPEAPTGVLLLAKELTGTLLYSLPYALGMTQVCPLQDLPLYGSWKPDTLSCVAIQGSWGVACLAALATATVLAARSLGKSGASLLRRLPLDDQQRQVSALLSARLVLLMGAWLTIAAFTFSETAAQKPWSMRYLTGLLIAAPAVLWPLVSGLRGAWSNRARLRVGAMGGALLLVSFVWAVGTVQTFTTIPAVVRGEQQEHALSLDLMRNGITRVYSGYWVCDRLIFATQEQVICSVVGLDLLPGLNRYQIYRSIVVADPHAAYLFPEGSDFAEAYATRLSQSNAAYSTLHFDGYVVYVPH
jgi:hypothetical protein